MSQDTGTTTAPAGTAPTEPAAPEPPTEWAPPASQAELDRIIGDRLARQKAQYAGFDDYKAKAAQFDEIAEANKTELQRASDARVAAEERAATASRDLARYRVAAEKQIPADLVDLLVGDDEEQMSAVADRLIAHLSTAAPAPTVPGFDVGSRMTPVSGDDMNAQIRARLRGR